MSIKSKFMNSIKLFNIALSLSFMVALFACQNEEESFDWVPGNSLHILGSDEVPYGSAQSFRVDGFTIDENYTWTLNGNPVEPTRQGEFVSIDFPAPGDYMLMVSDGNLSDTLSVTALPVTLGFAGNATTVTEDTDTVKVPLSFFYTVETPDGPSSSGTDVSSSTTVSYTIGGTAVAGEDYTLVSDNPLEIDAEASADSIVIALTNNTMLEAPRTITLTLNSVSSEGTGTVLSDSAALNTYTITIVDDIKTITLAGPGVDTLSAITAAGAYTFEVSLSSPVATDVTVPYTVTGTGVDDLTDGEVTFLAGQTSASIILELEPAAFDADQTITVALGNALVTEDAEVMYEEDEDNNPVNTTQAIVIDVP